MSCKHDCNKPSFPKAIFNRPGLTEILYRIGTYADMREHMFDHLNKRAELAAWTHRGADDPGIALLEATAEVGDILTFYQQLYANEAYLRTADWVESVRELIQLTGYRLYPGVGSLAEFALTIKGGQAVTVPEAFGFKVPLAGQKQSAEFETSHELRAYPALSQFKLYQRRTGGGAISKNAGLNRLEIQAVNTHQDSASLAKLDLKAGDRLMIVPDAPALETQGASYADQDPMEILIVQKVERILDRVVIYFDGSLRVNRPSSITAYPIGRSFRHFGYNAPNLTSVFNSTTRSVSQEKTEFNRRMDIAQTAPSGQNNYYTSLAAIDIPLESEVNDLAAGGLLICEGMLKIGSAAFKLFSVVRKIDTVIVDSLVWGNITSPASVINLTEKLVTNTSLSTPTIDVRKFRCHEVVGPKLTLRTPVEWGKGALNSAQLNVYANEETIKALKGRALLLQHQDGRLERHVVSEQAAVMAAYSATANSSDEARLYTITLTQIPAFNGEDFDEAEPKIIVYGNLVKATQGKTETEVVLGSGDNRKTFQTFAIPKVPLTYLLDQSQTPPPPQLPELNVYVNGVLWQPVDSFFNRQPKESIYVLRQDDEGKSWVQFGDGKNGARLPSGKNNVVAIYRTGVGANGAVETGEKVTASGKLIELGKIFMPAPAAGGDEAEDKENARVAAPGKMQSLGRLVSLADFEAEALALPGVQKARAAWEAPTGSMQLRLTVLSQKNDDSATETIRQAIQTANRCRGLARFSILAVPGHRQYVYLNINLGHAANLRSPDVVMQVKAALGVSNDSFATDGLFGLSQCAFGRNIHVSQIIAAVQQVSGVAWVKVIAAQRIDQTSLTDVDPAALSKPSSPALNKTLDCGGDEILALYSAHLDLILSVEQDSKECA